jgi:hypothetical protein
MPARSMHFTRSDNQTARKDKYLLCLWIYNPPDANQILIAHVEMHFYRLILLILLCPDVRSSNFYFFDFYRPAP